MTRVPYPDRADVIARHCLCPATPLYDLVTTHDDGTETREPIHAIALDCPLHSPDARFGIPESL